MREEKRYSAEEAKAEAIGWLNSWIETKRNELPGLIESAKKKYRKLGEIAARRVNNPVIRSILKIGDKWLRFAAKRLERKIRNAKKEIRAMQEAITQLKEGNPTPAKKILADRLLNAHSVTSNDFSDTPFGTLDNPFTSLCMRLFEGLDNLNNQQS